jgi:DNA-nicking Smr family endonuclease
MPKSKSITKQDSELFRQSVGKVKRIEHDEVMFDRPKPPTTNRDTVHTHNTTTLDTQDLYNIKAGDKLLFKRPGIQQQLFRKLKRGQIPVEIELDLHGMTIPSAKKALMQFFEYCLDSNHRCVRIIHGKGKGSENNLPILKNNLNQWLPEINEVLAFCSAQPSDGGVGAIYVLMKTQ